MDSWNEVNSSFPDVIIRSVSSISFRLSFLHPNILLCYLPSFRRTGKGIEQKHKPDAQLTHKLNCKLNIRKEVLLSNFFSNFSMAVEKYDFARIKDYNGKRLSACFFLTMHMGVKLIFRFSAYINIRNVLIKT